MCTADYYTVFKTYEENVYVSWHVKSWYFACVGEKASCAATAKALQSCPTLCDPIDGSLPGSPIPGILQARTLEWVAISFSNAWKWKVKGKSLSGVWPSATPWTAAYQAPLSIGFSRQEYWSGVPLPSPKQAVDPHRCNMIPFVGEKRTLSARLCVYLHVYLCKYAFVFLLRMAGSTHRC